MQASFKSAGRWLLVWASAHRSAMISLYLVAWLVFATVGFLVGSTYDYGAYLRQWTRILGGENPWLSDPGNVYGVGHQILAPLLYVHPLAPKLLFIFCWLGSFVIILEARRDGAAVDLVAFLALFATPFFVILICIYGVEDALVTFLTLAAIDLRTRKARTVAPAILLAAAVLTKLYPVALLPFLATDRAKVDFRFIIIFMAAMALGLLFTVALWGWPFLRIVEVAAVRDGKMLSIFWFLSESRFSPVTHTPLAKVLSDWNMAVVIVAMTSLYGVHFFVKMRALAGTVLASIGLLAAYKVGNPPYFVCPATLLIYFLAMEIANDGRSKRALVAAAAGYLLVLNVFQFWYYLTHGSFQYPQVRAFIGLPCLVTAVFLMGQILISERRAHGIRR